MGAISFLDPFRRLSVPPLAGLKGQGCGDLGCRGAAAGLLSALPQHSFSFQYSHPNAFLQPHLHQGGCSGGGHLGLHCHGCCGACSTHFSRLLQPSVRSVEDLEVMASGHRPLPSHSLCGHVSLPDGDHSVCAPGGASGGLDALHRSDGSVPSSAGSSSSRHFLRLLFRDTVYQFKALCFGLSTALQVFTRVMAPVSAILHSMGIRMRRYLDDWLVQSSSRESLLVDLQTVLQLCHELGIVVNPQKSNLVPSPVVQYLGVVIASTSFRASPSVERISRLQSTAAVFQSCASPTASLWLSLLGVLSSLAHLVPGGRLRMQSLQLCLHRSWDRQDLEAPVFASMECLRDLQWWLHLPRLSLGVSLCQVSPDLHFWSDVGWGAHLYCQIASGLWDAQQAALSINARELLDVQLGLYQFRSSLQGRTVAVFCDNTTAVAYLRKEGGTRSPLLNTLAQEILRWTESLSIRLAPQFLPGSNNVLADALSRPHQLPHSQWSLNLTVFQSLRRLWPVQIDLFATSANHRCSIYFSPFRDPMSAGTDAFLQSWDGLQAYAFPPVAIILRVLAKLWASTGTELTLVAPHWAQRPWFSDLLQLSLAPPVVLPSRPDLLRLPLSRHLYPDLRRLRLHAWRLYSDLQSCWLFLRSSGAVFAGAPSILARGVSGAMVHLLWVVSLRWPFCLSSYLS